MNERLELLTDCDKESIQFIDSIQPFGALIVTDRRSVIVAAAMGPLFDGVADDLIGKHLRVVLGDNYDRIFEAIEERSEPPPPFLIRDSNGNWITCIAYQQGNQTIFEIERVPKTQVDIASIKFMLERGESLESYLSYVVENFQVVTGYDRVMIYKFANDWHGEVVAESLSGEAYSFYGHHFPASDIPVPARDLFSKIWVRMIVNVDDKLTPILGPAAGEKLDLTRSILRSSAPVHLQYLRNMGVAASLTLSLMCEGKLWGLVACHHFTPRYLTGEERSICSMIAKTLSARITALALVKRLDTSLRITRFPKPFYRDAATGELLEYVRDNKNSLLNLIDSNGFTFVDGETIVSEGNAPTKAEIRLLTVALEQTDQTLIHTDAIAGLDPGLQELDIVAAGVIAFKVDSCWLIWNRHELARTIMWAGNPQKPVYREDNAVGLRPRDSFESWLQEVRGHSVDWQPFEIEAVEKLAGLLRQDKSGNTSAINDQTQYLEDLRTGIAGQLAFLQSEFNNPTLEAMRLAELIEVSGSSAAG